MVDETTTAAAPASVPAPGAEKPAKKKLPRLQRGWLIVYWVALVITFLLLVQALRGVDVVSFTSLVAIILATVAIAIGVLLAMRIARRGVTNAAFVKATTTTRVIAVAWLLVQVGIYTGAIVATLANVDVTVVDWTQGFLGTVGSLSILAIAGPGYTEYREALATADRPTP